MNRSERRRQYFHKQKDFYKSFTGTVLVDDVVVRLGDGQVVDADKADADVRPDIKIEDGVVSMRDTWAYNPTLLKEFLSFCLRKAKPML